MTILQILYLLFVGFLIYTMVKKGGCCGGHGNHRGHSNHNTQDHNIKHKNNLTKDEKNNAIDI